MKIMVCKKCGGERVTSDAAAIWDFDNEWCRDWCHDCNGDTNIESKLAPFDEAWSDEIKAKWMKAKIEESNNP